MTKPITPITPDEAKEDLINNFPSFVVEAINNAIKKNYFGKSNFTIKQKDIVSEIEKLMPEEFSGRDIFDKHWLDFEELYGKFGWKVVYDKGYSENYEEYFKFTKNDRL